MSRDQLKSMNQPKQRDEIRKLFHEYQIQI